MRRWILAMILGALPVLALAAGAPGVFTGTLTADTVGTEEYIMVPTGRAVFSAVGTYGGGTLTLQTVFPNEATGSIPSASWTADIVTARLDSGGCTLVRVQLTGATAPSIYWTLTPEHFKVGDQISADCSQYKPE